ncbi:hypothetical protein JXA02_05285 [candidate division KSB1 bacterium]|nr:hypothetical protein [candidate division KSB1 bacterium]
MDKPFYSPNGESVNGRKEYTYSDADKAVGQPDFVARGLLGVNYHF